MKGMFLLYLLLTIFNIKIYSALKESKLNSQEKKEENKKSIYKGRSYIDQCGRPVTQERKCIKYAKDVIGRPICPSTVCNVGPACRGGSMCNVGPSCRGGSVCETPICRPASVCDTRPTCRRESMCDTRPTCRRESMCDILPTRRRRSVCNTRPTCRRESVCDIPTRRRRSVCDTKPTCRRESVCDISPIRKRRSNYPYTDRSDFASDYPTTRRRTTYSGDYPESRSRIRRRTISPRGSVRIPNDRYSGIDRRTRDNRICDSSSRSRENYPDERGDYYGGRNRRIERYPSESVDRGYSEYPGKCNNIGNGGYRASSIRFSAKAPKKLAKKV